VVLEVEGGGVHVEVVLSVVKESLAGEDAVENGG